MGDLLKTTLNNVTNAEVTVCTGASVARFPFPATSNAASQACRSSGPGINVAFANIHGIASCTVL